ncbi:MAG: AsnC family protein [Deltaproteobacteria bacterium]|nr:AsnC family protein [Deltaproteobacteria bacterium]
MARGEGGGLNETGESGVARIVRSGALHHSCGERTSPHAHVAWKVHVGIDAPVWVRGEGLEVGIDAGVRVVVAPPGWTHATGAAGWSCAVFAAPGRLGAPWRGDRPFAIEGVAAERLVGLCRRYGERDRLDTPDFIQDTIALSLGDLRRPRIDRRVGATIEALEVDPDRPLRDLARAAGVSLDRLSRLVTRDTAIHLRRHALWSRLMGLLSSNATHANLAAAAFDAGFADHAHLSRTYRALLGRAPSEFDAPPDTVQPWSGT